jgi:dihydroneopterin triphosphate diphosphatase
VLRLVARLGVATCLAPAWPVMADVTPADEGGRPVAAVAGSSSGAGRPGATAPPYKRPESVLVVVFTRAGEFLLLRRTRPRDFWQSVTGSLRVGESPRHAALRELREETGLKVSPSALLDLHRTERFPILPAWRARYAPGVHYNLEHWFAVCIPGHRLILLNPAEHLESRWLPAPRAAAMATSWTNRNAIQAIGALAMVPR